MDKALQDSQSTVRIPVFSEDIPRRNDPYFDQMFINCFPEVSKNSVTGETSVSLVKRPGLKDTGLSVYSISGSANANNLICKANITITQLSDVCVCVMQDAVASKLYVIQYRPIAGTYVLIGTVSSITTEQNVHLTECQIASAGTIYASIMLNFNNLACTTSATYWARSNGTVFTTTSLTQIVAAAFPGTVGKIVTGPVQQLNGIFYAYTTDGIIYNSGSTAGTVNDPTLWNALSVINTYQYPDGGVRLERYKHHLIAFGRDSIEFFNDIGNPPPASGLQRTDQAYINFGVYGNKAVVTSGDTLFWIARGSNGTFGVYQMQGYTPVKISNGKQDKAIQFSAGDGGLGVGVNEALGLFTVLIGGKVHLGIRGVIEYSGAWQVNFGSGSGDTYSSEESANNNGKHGNLMYNVDDRVWWGFRMELEPDMVLYPSQNFPPQGDSGAVDYKNYIFLGGSSVGDSKIYTWQSFADGNYVDDATTSNNACPVMVVIGFNLVSFDNEKRKRINRITPIFSSKPAIKTTDTNVMGMYLLYNKTNNSDPTAGPGTNTFYRRCTYPNSAQRYYWNNLGMSRDWNFTVACLSKDSFSLKALEMNVEQEEH